MSTPIISSFTTTTEQKELPSLQPFPFKPDAQQTPKRIKCPPPPSPSKFVKGEFKESDYESDYDGKIPAVWGKDVDKSYRPVRPVLTPSGRHSQASRERTPTPPTEFDQPPQFTGPARPKFEPIEKPKKTIKLNEVTKPLPKQVVFKPKPIPAKPMPLDDIVVATPAIPDLKPGTPPEIGFVPGPKTTQYYKSTTSTPYHNAVQTETSKVMHFTESTEHSHRTASIQQSTKVIKFGEQTQGLEPFPFKPDESVRQRRSSAPPPSKPKKFVPGEFRESDYESEVESTRIKSMWVPGASDSEEPHFRKVRAPVAVRSSSVPAPKERVETPMEFDKGPAIPSQLDGGMVIKKVPSKITTSSASKIASKHMDSMTKTFKTKTQQFVSDIQNDVSKQQKPILKGSDSTDAQVYREESRAAQYGKNGDEELCV